MAWPAALGSMVVKGRGKREREAQGVDSPPRFWGRRPAGRGFMAAGHSRRRAAMVALRWGLPVAKVRREARRS